MRKKALIVDDERYIRDLVGDLMQTLDYDTETFSNAEDALRSVQETAFDVVFTDYDLGGGRMNGLTFARRLAEQSDHPPYVILMSGGEVPGLEIGQDIAAFLQKPFTFAEFKSVLPR